MKVNQIVINREYKMVNEGIMGFNDWTKHKEDFETFIQRVTEVMREHNTIFVTYPTEDIAIIQYWME